MSGMFGNEPILVPGSGEHWLGVREYERKWGTRPEDLVGPDGYDLIATTTGPKLRLTAAGRDRLTKIMADKGPAALAVLDQVLAAHRTEFGC